jgi:exopolysaccharide/PEP-CTERM locus tyrosine autokinase
VSIIEKAASRLDAGLRPKHDGAAVLAQPAFGATLPPPMAPAAAPAIAAAEPRIGKRVELDLARMHAMGLVTAAGGRTPLVEDFRLIKRPLIKRALERTAPGANPNNMLMVTSALPGEGKTFCAINLAMSIAMELDHTVMLVDADVARPNMLKTLGLPEQQGLMDLLLDDKLDVSDVMLRTNVDTLTLLPAGAATPRATELLASQGMTALVAEIASRYPERIVIFDSPPLLLTSEANELASHMGQIIMVVEAERTTQHAVKEAISKLNQDANVSLLYNKMRDFAGVEGYGYNYA